MTGGKRKLDLLDHHDAIAELWRTCQACGLRWRWRSASRGCRPRRRRRSNGDAGGIAADSLSVVRQAHLPGRRDRGVPLPAMQAAEPRRTGVGR